MYKILKPFNKGLFTDVVSGLFAVQKPITDKQQAEARNCNLTVLSKSTDPNLNLYKFNSCGHTAFLQPTHVRRKNVSCKTCFWNKLVNTVHSNNEHLLFYVGDGKFRIVRKCEHIVDSYRHFERGGIEQCSLCFEESLILAAAKNNYTYIKDCGAGYREIVFKTCGHTKVLHQSQIFKGNAVCRICQEEGYRVAAEKSGLRVLTTGARGERYRDYELPCGCVKSLRLDHAADGSWLCEVCDDTHYNKPSSVYLLEISTANFSWLKLGYAKNVHVRSVNYQLVKQASVNTLRILETKTGSIAKQIELNLHNKYKDDRLNKNFMRKYHLGNGFSECYPIELKENLLREFECLMKGRT